MKYDLLLSGVEKKRRRWILNGRYVQYAKKIDIICLLFVLRF